MNRRPKFFWQGVLIVMPVLLLTVVGILSLWKDRETVTLEARRMAEQQAEQLAAFLATELHSALQEQPYPSLPFIWRSGTVIGTDGDLRTVGPNKTPGSYRKLQPSSPFPLTELDTPSAALWTAARSAEITDSASATDAYTRFLETNPPEPFVSNARYAQALLLARNDEPESALARFRTLIDSDATTETGLPLRTLAAFQQVKLLATHPSNDASTDDLREAIDALGTSATHSPSRVTGQLLSSAADLLADSVAEEQIRSYQQLWLTDENTRAFYRYIKTSPDTRARYNTHVLDRMEGPNLARRIDAPQSIAA